ncbi:MAG: methyl-accepting chemotaxis protein [Thermoanaerobacteraceae bacterium]|nr:methyl-accepting chemotaxis protein [Thermoanaerobacteraceae bacterium]
MLRRLGDHRAVVLANLEGALGHYNAAAAYLRGFALTGNPAYVTKYQKAIGDADAHLKKVLPALQAAEDSQLYEEFQKKTTALKQYGEQLIPLVQAREAATGPDRAAAEKELAAFNDSHKGIVEAVIEAGESLADRQAELMRSGQDLVSARVNHTMNISIALVVATMVLGLIIAFFIARAIANPIRLVDAGAAKIAAGDLTGDELRIKAKDETGRMAESFNTMLANLKEIVRQLQEKAKTVATSAGELSAGAENVSAGVAETSSNINEVASTVEQVTARAQKIAETSSRSASYAWEGKEGIQNIVTQMGAIQRATGANEEIIRSLNESAVRISQIVGLITHVADQTNMLALNAAIEAARAGEHGRGFAVVAEEVRKLAEQSAGAAGEINTLITAVQQKSQKAVQSMSESTSQVETGARVVQDVGATFEKIIADVESLAEEIQAVAAAAEEMSSAVENVAAASEEQTATMEEVSAIAQNLSGLAVELETLAGRFKLA